MKIKAFLLILAVIANCPVADAQKKKRAVKKQSPRVEAVEKYYELAPEIKNFAFVVNIDKNANVTLAIQKTGDSETLADVSETKSLTNFFTAFSRLQNSKTPDKPTDLFAPTVIIKADSSLNFGEVIKIIQAVRVSDKQKIKLKISENLDAFVPPKIMNDDLRMVKPNPSLLVVNLRTDSKILLNQERMGDLENTSPLAEILKEVFIARDNNGIFREGTNEIERTVFVKAPLSVKFSDVIRLIQAIAGAGASPIGLQVDDLE